MIAAIVTAQPLWAWWAEAVALVLGTGLTMRLTSGRGTHAAPRTSHGGHRALPPRHAVTAPGPGSEPDGFEGDPEVTGPVPGTLSASGWLMGLDQVLRETTAIDPPLDDENGGYDPRLDAPFSVRPGNSNYALHAQGACHAMGYACWWCDEERNERLAHTWDGLPVITEETVTEWGARKRGEIAAWKNEEWAVRMPWEMERI